MDADDRTYELDKIGTRFDQFIIAVNGALIAYAFKQIEGHELALTQIPLGLAIVSWGFSFFFGVSSVRRLISTRIIGVLKDTDIIKQNQQYSTIVRDKFNEVGKKANNLNKRMFQFLYIGGIFYIIWQILEMALRTFCKS